MNLSGLFARPDRLWLLLVFLPMAAWVARGSRRRSLEWAILGQSGRPRGDGSWWRLASASLIVLSLAQPRWGRTLGPEPPPGHDVVLLVDASRSMAAEDAVPDRLGLAVEAGSSLIQALEPGGADRAAVIAFAGRAVVRCPLTAHLDAARDALGALRTGEIEPGGTDLGAAIHRAIEAFDDEDHAAGRTLVIFSDGEDHVDSWRGEVDRLRHGGIVVHCVAVGDEDRSHPVPKAGRKDAGSPAETRRSDLALRSIAEATGGVFMPIGRGSGDLTALFRDRLASTARRRRDEVRIAGLAERFPVFLMPATALLLASSWPSTARRRRRSRAFGLAIALSGVFATAGAGSPGETARGLLARGIEAYKAGRFDRALQDFDRAIALDQAAAVPRFDAASTLFQLGRLSEAIRRYEEARDRGDAALAIKIDYALGNAHLALGHLDAALAHYDACVSSTLEGEGLDAVRLDAAENRAFVAGRRNPPPDSPGSGNPEPPSSGRKRDTSRRGDSDRGESKSSPADPPSPQNGRAERQGGGDGKAASRRGGGGAGGSGQAPPEVGSPEERLESALKDIREARASRPPDPPRAGAKALGKDW